MDQCRSQLAREGAFARLGQAFRKATPAQRLPADRTLREVSPIQGETLRMLLSQDSMADGIGDQSPFPNDQGSAVRIAGCSLTVELGLTVVTARTTSLPMYLRRWIFCTA